MVIALVTATDRQLIMKVQVYVENVRTVANTSRERWSND